MQRVLVVNLPVTLDLRRYRIKMGEVRLPVFMNINIFDNF